jgi:hypothetical protein
MQTRPLPETPSARSPAGAEIRYLLKGTPGVSIDIPVGTAFQYRCTGTEELRFLCITMPPWPGDAEATVIEGPWAPTAPVGPVSCATAL